jgi:hypothetical protein
MAGTRLRTGIQAETDRRVKTSQNTADNRIKKELIIVYWLCLSITDRHGTGVVAVHPIQLVRCYFRLWKMKYWIGECRTILYLHWKKLLLNFSLFKVRTYTAMQTRSKH